MITEHDLESAIAECRGARNPNASTCIKLAAYYILMDHLYPDEPDVMTGYSHAPGPVYDSGSEFSEAVSRISAQDAFSVMDELMDALRVLNPRLYDSAMQKLREK